jgi:hypothetical protein
MPSRPPIRGNALSRALKDDKYGLGQIAAGLTPAGPAIDIADFAQAKEAEDLSGMALAGIGFIPGVGDALKAILQLKKAGRAGDAQGAIGRLELEYPGMDVRAAVDKMENPTIPSGPQSKSLIRETAATDALESLDLMEAAQARAQVAKLRQSDPEMFEEIIKQAPEYRPKTGLEIKVDNGAMDRMLDNPQFPTL